MYKSREILSLKHSMYFSLDIEYSTVLVWLTIAFSLYFNLIELILIVSFDRREHIEFKPKILNLPLVMISYFSSNSFVIISTSPSATIMQMKCYISSIIQSIFTTIENVSGIRWLIVVWQRTSHGMLRSSVMKDFIITF